MQVHEAWMMGSSTHISDSCNHVSSAGAISSISIIAFSLLEPHMYIVYCALAADEPLKVLFDLQGTFAESIWCLSSRFESEDVAVYILLRYI